MENPDCRMYPHLFHLLGLRCEHMPRVFDALLDPCDHEDQIASAEEEIAAIAVPLYTGAGAFGDV
jgi:uncharacterized protein